MSAPRLDATNIAGITTLMNPQHLKSNINLQQVENTIMKKEKSTKSKLVQDDFDPVKFYSNEISQLAEELGVDLVSAYDTQKKEKDTIKEKIKEENQKVIPRSPNKIEIIDLNIASESSNSSSESESSRISKISKSSKTSKNSKSSKTSKSSRISKTSLMPENIDRFMSKLDKDMGIDISQEKYKRRFDMPHVKHDEEPNNVVKNIVSEMYSENKTSYGSEREKIQDIKLSKIEQISQLKMTLEEEGISCDNIIQPNIESSLEQIDAVLNILRLKNDRNRYSTLAEEIILGMAEGIETIFDGNRKVPVVNWQPDYRGYHSTVNIKLHRMRFETSQVVGGIIDKYEISPIMRIIMELLPSFFLYPRQQSKQRSSPGLHTDPQIHDASMAFANISEMEKKKKEEISKL